VTRHILIIGNGISGITAARTIRASSDHAVTVVSSESPYFISRTALMYAYMGQIRYSDLKPYPDHDWARVGIELRHDYATRIRHDEHIVELASGESLPFDDLVIATGSRPNRFGWPGENAPGVQGLYSMQDLQVLESESASMKSAVIVGGGLIGIELSEMLRSRGIPVTFLVRERSYMNYLLPADASEMVTRHIGRYGIDFRFGTQLESIETNSAGRACAVRTSHGDVIESDFVGLTAGVRPNVDLAASSDVETAAGVLIDRRFRTSRENVYAIGDCAEFRRPLPSGGIIEQLWYSGRRHGQVLGRNLAGEDIDYTPGIFFNSAKFFDLEYQQYGRVDAVIDTEFDSITLGDLPNQQLIRIQFEAFSSVVVGLMSLGVRLKHQVCDEWISSGTVVDIVLRDFRNAIFDPEFSRRVDIPSGRPVASNQISTGS
jgi:NADPH-dependent 2,4-dienoyl-CoA reductase/sulfur reductase-like enzyme